jgi:copper chaperone CopZ
MLRLNLKVGGMESRDDVSRIRAALDPLPGIDAFDVLKGRVRMSYDPKAIPLSRIFAAIAEAGEGYDVELD